MKDYKPSIEISVLENEDLDYELVKIIGDFDKAGLEAVKDQLNEIVDAVKQKRLVFDFTDLNYINSEGIGFLMTIHTKLTEVKKELVVVGSAEHVYDVLKVIGLINLIHCYKNLTEFQETIK